MNPPCFLNKIINKFINHVKYDKIVLCLFRGRDKNE